MLPPCMLPPQERQAAVQEPKELPSLTQPIMEAPEEGEEDQTSPERGAQAARADSPLEAEGEEERELTLLAPAVTGEQVPTESSSSSATRRIGMSQKQRSVLEQPAEAVPDVKPKGLKYSRVSGDEQSQILEARLRNLEVEHFQHDANLKVHEKASNEDGAIASRAAMVAIEFAHSETTRQLKDLKK